MAKSTKQRRQSFSERNGYVDPTDVMILGEDPKVVANAISSALCRVFQAFKSNPWRISIEHCGEQTLAQAIWTDVMNEDLAKFDLMFDRGYKEISNWITSESTPWYRKLDLVEFISEKLSSLNKSKSEQFVEEINEQFVFINVLRPSAVEGNTCLIRSNMTRNKIFYVISTVFDIRSFFRPHA